MCALGEPYGPSTYATIGSCAPSLPSASTRRRSAAVQLPSERTWTVSVVALGRAADRERMPLVPRDRRDAQEHVVARRGRRTPAGAAISSRVTPERSACAVDDRPSSAPRRASGAPARPRSRGAARRAKQQERGRVGDREHEPHHVEQVREVEELEAARAPDDASAKTHMTAKTTSEHDAREPALGEERIRDRARIGWPPRVADDERGAVARAERRRACGRRCGGTSIASSTGTTRPSQRRAHPREQAAHHRHQDQRAVEVDARRRSRARAASARSIGCRAAAAQQRRREDADVRERPRGRRRRTAPSRVLEEARDHGAARVAPSSSRARRSSFGAIHIASLRVICRAARGACATTASNSSNEIRPSRFVSASWKSASASRSGGCVARSATSLSARLIAIMRSSSSLLDRAVAVVIVQAEREHQLLALGPEDEPAHPGEELVALDHAVAVPIERREHAPREVLAAQPERAFSSLTSMTPSAPARRRKRARATGAAASTAEGRGLGAIRPGDYPSFTESGRCPNRCRKSGRSPPSPGRRACRP